jgi:hypothetical protein
MTAPYAELEARLIIVQRELDELRREVHRMREREQVRLLADDLEERRRQAEKE